MVLNSAAVTLLFGCCLGFISVIHLYGIQIYTHYLENTQLMAGSVKTRRPFLDLDWIGFALFVYVLK